MTSYAQKEIEFFGKITAASTHEMKNVLAIIKETSGLMEDLMTLSPETPMTLREKFQNTLSVIASQIKRGAEISDRLNRFAHSTDVPVANIDLYTAAEQITALAQRFARLKQVDLKLDPPALPMTVAVRPVRLLMTLFGCIECCLNRLPAGAHVRVATREKNSGFEISFICQGDFSCLPDLSQGIATDSRWTDLKQMAASLGGAIELGAADPCIRLYLPEPTA